MTDKQVSSYPVVTIGAMDFPSPRSADKIMGHVGGYYHVFHPEIKGITTAGQYREWLESAMNTLLKNRVFMKREFGDDFDEVIRWLLEMIGYALEHNLSGVSTRMGSNDEH